MIDLDKFFTELSPNKVFLIGIFCSALFWYLDIYLFDKKLITGEQIQIPIIISLCLGFLWYFINIIIGLAIVDLSESNHSNPLPSKEKINKGIFVSVFTSVITLSIVTLIKLYVNSTFRNYVLISFFSLIILTVLFGREASKAKNKKQ